MGRREYKTISKENDKNFKDFMVFDFDLENQLGVNY